MKIFSLTHNPLNIHNEILKPAKLKCNGIYFYKYHHLPPFFENYDKIGFRKNSLKLEKPTGWKGYLLSSNFILDCQV